MSSSSISPGDRVRAHRKARGLSQSDLAAQSGLSVTTVKFIENGKRSLTLSAAQKLAPALRIDDLAELLGPQVGHLPMTGRLTHPSIPAVRRALTNWSLTISGEPQSVEYLRAMVDAAWNLWHTSQSQRTEVGEILPDLLEQLQLAARLHTGQERRQVLTLLAQAYHQAQAYLAWHGDRELVWLSADRAMSAALETDDPVTIAGSVWYSAHLLRATGRSDEAVERLREALDLIQPLVEAGPRSDAPGHVASHTESVAMLADLHLCGALTRARAGDQAAWAEWGKAHRIVTTMLPKGYAHPWTKVGTVRTEVYGVMCAVELGDTTSATRHAEALDPATIHSTEHRARHLLELARLADLEGSREGVLHLLNQAAHVSAEVVSFSPVGRDMVRRAVETAPAYLRASAVALAGKVSIVLD
ncbi:helix-turn-helix transcriptional regulator [Longispora sp. NPDC051575]|uniref:helix-turn-helix domain-containing protein n=1 Tax=Longispora sp. NPDC051575 TaxID=3154943 RepID=UPI00344501E7